MSQSNDESTLGAPVGDREQDGWILFTDVKVSSGRVRLPDRVRDRWDLGTGDVLDVVVVKADWTTIDIPETAVGAQHRISIDPERLDMHDLRGSYVDVWVRDTGEDYGED